MTRMWMVSPALLCDEHLQREHWEIHQLDEQVRGEWNMSGHAQAMKVFGHAVRGQVFPSLIERRHTALTLEYGRRDIDHDSPIEQPAVAGLFDSATVTTELLSHNRAELARRCEKCRRHQTETLL